MKKVYSYSLLSLFLIPGIVTAQTETPVYRPAQAMYLEAGGAGLSYSFNYDRRFKGDKGLGIRGGLSYISREDDVKMFSAPLQLNYLMGKGVNFFELGAGVTYFYLDDYLYCSGLPGCNSGESEFLLPVKTKGDVMATFTFGFRHQPKNGIMYRLAVTPVANRSGFWPLFAGLSFGYSF
jgi:hypothetical protein